jgi:CHAT domain-containing protein
MKLILSLLAILFILGCSDKSKEPLAVEDSFYELVSLSNYQKLDTTQLSRLLRKAYKTTNSESNCKYDSLVAYYSQYMADTLIKAKKRSEARFYSVNGLRLGTHCLSKNSFLISQLYHSTCLSYYGEENYKLTLVYADSVKPLGNDFQTSVLTTKNQIIIAECYQNLKNLKSAESFYNNLKSLVETYLSDKEKVEYYNRFAYLQIGEKKFIEAINAAKRSVEILEKVLQSNKANKNDSLLLGNALYYIGFAYQDSTAYKESVYHYSKALDIYKKNGNMEGYRRGLMNMGLMYRYDKQFDKALMVLTEGITQLNSLEQTDMNILRKAKLLNNRGEVYFDLKDYQKVVADHDSALFYLTQYDRRASLTTLLMSNQKSLIWAYGDNSKAYAALAEKGVDTEGYLKSLTMTDKLVAVSDDIRADYFSDDAKMTLATDIKPYLEHGIGVCQKLYERTHDKAYLEKALSYLEFSRSMVLFENARLNSQLPPQYKAENEALKQQEAALVAKNNVDDLQKYLSQKRQFREKIKSLNKQQMPNLAVLQKELLTDNQTALLAFFEGDSTVTVFTILQNNLTVNTLRNCKDLDSLVLKFRKIFTKPAPDRNAVEFNEVSHQMYDKILRGGISALPPTVNKLIIAPDGVLAYLPFEILTPSVSAADFRQTDYLIKRFQISYAYSASLLLEQKRSKAQPTDKVFAGFAPTYNHRDTLKPIATKNKNTIAYQDNQTIASRALLTREGAYELKGAKDEVQQIQAVIGGKTYTHEAANEANFKLEAQQYRILHCAMHSLTDDKESMNSRLLFTLMPNDTTQDSDLTAAELYAMQLNADLAVLSACNTGYGKLSRGEGVMSLARAFTYAGVPATVTSLWKVPDLTTKDVMVEFYKNLKSGMTKDAALRQAKLTYLENAPESIAANPYFWAGFVPMGNMEAMHLSENTPLSMWAILGGLLVVLGGGFYFYRKIKTT